jgi:C1A family cysteine protease
MDITKRLGWRPDKPDFRDKPYMHLLLGPMPPKVDLRPRMPLVYDQGDLGSCTSNAIAAAIQYDRLKNKQDPDWVPARLLIYWNERFMEGTTDVDAGAEIRDGMKACAEAGVCDEKIWPYHIDKFDAKPPQAAWNAAKKHRITSYERVNQDMQDMKAVLASGFPIVIGFSVYSSFQDDVVKMTGVVPMPMGEEQLLGGHAVLVVGYDDSTSRWTVRNSWGDSWGAKGYFYMPYQYFTDPNLATDLWVAKVIES